METASASSPELLADAEVGPRGPPSGPGEEQGAIGGGPEQGGADLALLDPGLEEERKKCAEDPEVTDYPYSLARAVREGVVSRPPLWSLTTRPTRLGRAGRALLVPQCVLA